MNGNDHSIFQATTVQMNALFRSIGESFAQAFQQLYANRLRSLLSLLGITIGIFCIIGVQSAVDSMQSNIQGSLKKLGDDVVYIQKFPWTEDPHQNFWKYLRRPNPSFDDYEAIRQRVRTAELVDFHTFLGRKVAKYRSSSVEGTFLLAVTQDHASIFNLNFEKGRFYTPSEYHLGLTKVVIGHSIAEELFGQLDPIGKKINLMGRKLEVIGVIEKSGEDIIQVMNFDQVALLSYPLARKVANVKSNNPFGGTVAVKAVANADMETFKDEITIALRSERRLQPREEADFSINQLSVISNLLNQVFGVFDLVGLAIGIFAILVGCFSVANIMFVSVKERTNIIGVKKALGAKRHIILLEFLIESMVLCLIGGVIGLSLIYFTTLALNNVLPFPIFLSTGNILSGFLWSISIGIVAGILPALQASKMDPVEAMRSK